MHNYACAQSPNNAISLCILFFIRFEKNILWRKKSVRIIDEVIINKKVSPSYLFEKLKVSEYLIRMDIKELEEQEGLELGLALNFLIGKRSSKWIIKYYWR